MDRYGDMKKNGSGYIDPTPYQAVKSMYHPGEIWTHTHYDKEVLILKDHDGFCTALLLTDHEGRDGCIQVISRAVKYTHPGMVQYVFNHQLGMMVKKLPDQDFQMVLEEVGKAMGIHLTNRAECARQENAPVPSDEELDAVKAMMPGILRVIAKVAGGMADSLESGGGR